MPDHRASWGPRTKSPWIPKRKLLDKLIAGWPASNISVSVLGIAAEGVRVLATTGDAGRTYEWASLSKLLVALAVHRAQEEELLDLTDPAGPPGATILHLLAHASGLGPQGTVPITAPGRRRIYSNGGYEVLAGVVGAKSEMEFTEYLSEGVLGPLGCSGASLEEGASPASGATGSLFDLVALGSELLQPKVFHPDTIACFHRPAFSGLSGVVPGFGHFERCEWGAGPEIRADKLPHWTGMLNSPETFGHFGRAGGFLWVDPRVQLALAVLTDEQFGPWAAVAWPALSDAVTAEFSAQPLK